ncbi:MAG: hypothetical protein AAF484_16920, partial [Pseudomonadota bacterium]
FDIWLRIFNEDVASREASGIRKLHVWRDVDRPGHAVALFEVTDLERARAFFSSEDLAMHRERGGVAHVSVSLLAAP